MDNRYIIALELSGSQVKGAAATLDNSNAYSQFSVPVVEAVACEEKVDCVQYGRVQNLIDAARDVGYVIKKLENNPHLKKGKIVAAYVGLSGRSLGSVRSTAELNLPSEMEITSEIVKQLELEASKAFSDDKRPLKVLPRKFYVDNQVNPNPVGTLGSKLKGDFTIVICNKINQRNLEMVMGDRLQIDVRECVVTPLAVADMVLSQEEKQLGCALVDFGAQTTTISIYKDRALQYLATLPLGSKNITRDIAIGLNITEERAEMAKCQQGDATADTLEANLDESARINCYVQARLGEIIANINAQISYAGYKNADLPAGLIITGRGAKLKNIEGALEAQTKMKVRKAQIPNTVTVSDKTVDSKDYISLLSIVHQAAKTTDVGGCVKMPQPADINLDSQPAFNQAHTPVNTPEEDSSDGDWSQDDEQNEKDIQRREKELRKKAQKEAERREKKERKEQREREKENQPRRSPLDWIKKTIYNITAVDEGEDTSLDDNDN